MKKTLLLLSIVLTALGLQACGPHPGAGHWQARDAGNSRFTTVNVDFDGMAQLTPANNKDEAQRCFWSGLNADTIQLQCTLGDDSGLEFNYLLSVDPDSQPPLATLLQDAKPIGSYDKQARTAK